MLNIPVLLDTYILDSYTAKNLLPMTENYKLKRFKGLKIGVIGFDNETEALVIKEILDN